MAKKPVKAAAKKSVKTKSTKNNRSNATKVSKESLAGKPMSSGKTVLKTKGIIDEPKITLNTYDRIVSGIKPLLGDREITNLTKANVSSLAKKAGLPEGDFVALKAAYSLAKNTGLHPEMLFALSKLDPKLPLNEEVLATADPDDIRKILKEATKKNVVSREIADSFDAYKPLFARLQSRVPLSSIANKIDHKISPELAKSIEESNITLADIRTAGGLANIRKLELKPDDPFVKKIDVYANLTLATDVQTIPMLIEKGYSHIYDIAKKTSNTFVKDLTPTIGADEAARIHVVAKAQTAILDNKLTDFLVNWSNRHHLDINKKRIDILIKNDLPDKCGCDDCEAAVSPLAYLADLMGYAVFGLHDNDQEISFDYLTKQFCQPFSDLPVACEQMCQEVRQVRLCIEVLRRAPRLKILSPAVKALRGKEAAYRQDAYERLLRKLGASYVDLRAAHGATLEARTARTALAARLGIPLGATPPTLTDNLDTLQLNLATATELDLEKLFGLVDTTRDPLCSCAKSVDEYNQITRWKWAGVKWGINTDAEGRVFLSIKKVGTKKYKVEAFSDAARTQIEASGEADSPTATIALESAANLNGLSGELSIAYKRPDENIEMQVVPLVQSWRLQKLRTQWQAQDWITDRYLPSAGEQQLPIIDPDLIGPDNFRMPVEKAIATDQDKAFDIWIKRRDWMDDLLRNLREQAIDNTGVVLSAPFDNLFTFMKDTTYDAFAKPFWDTNAATKINELHATISQSADKTAVATAKADLWSNYKLTPEPLKRLLDIIKIYDDWIYDPSHYPAVSEDEWQEVFSILAQTQKAFWFGKGWIKEETLATLVFGPKDFWMSEREPKEGDWPPQSPGKEVPRIDPEMLKREELPDPTTGKVAIALWDARAKQLREFRANELTVQLRDYDGATLRITTALPDPGAPTIADLEGYYGNLKSDTKTVVDDAKLKIEKLYFSVEDFEKVMRLRERLHSTLLPMPPKPTDSEWAEMEKILTNVYRVRTLWPKWAKAEAKLELKDWQMLKIRLPKWRSTAEDRQAWHRALQARSAEPLVDPDLLRDGHFRSRKTNVAKKIFASRAAKVVAKLQPFVASAQNMDGLELRMTDALGPFANNDLAGLISDMKKGGVSDARLEQLTITRAELTLLVRLHGLLAESPSQKLTQKEWDSIASILTQVWKRREFAEWRKEEQDSNLTASPDWFKLPDVDRTKFPPTPPPLLPEWRATRSDLLDWEDRLQSRMDQEAALIAGLQNAIGEVEEATLPALRDALVRVVGPPDDSLDEQADWVTEHLLIDAKQGGCQKTNRIAQAIEAIQQLLWSVRTGLLTDSHPNLKLDAPQFDEEWKWIGSYATWRAAMFVFLYTENIAIPSLRRHQTPGLKKLIDDLRGIRKLTSQKALEKANEYAGYFNDICSLDLQASARTATKASGDYDETSIDTTHSAEFLFALSSTSKKLYWSMYDLSLSSKGHKQTFWRLVDGFSDKHVVKAIGALAYTIAGNRNYLYLFIKTQKDWNHKLYFVKYNLDIGEWEGEPTEIELKSISSFDAKVGTTIDNRPAVIITPGDADKANAPIYIILDKDGGVDGSSAVTVGEVSSLSKAIPCFGWLNQHFQYLGEGGVAAARFNNNTELVFSGLVLFNSTNSVWDIHKMTSKIKTDGSLDFSNTPMTVPFLVSPPRRSVGTDVFTRPDGTQDLLVFYVEDRDGEDRAVFRIGRNLQVNGTVSTWDSEQDAGLTDQHILGTATLFSDISLVDIGGKKYLYLLYVDEEGAGTRCRAWYLRRELDQTGNLVGGWSTTFPIPSIGVNAGVGIAVRDIDGDGDPELTAVFLDQGQKKAYYYIGSDLQPDGSFAQWNKYGEQKEIKDPVGTGNGGILAGATIADLTNSGLLDLVLLTIDKSNSLANVGICQIAFGFGINQPKAGSSLPDTEGLYPRFTKQLTFTDRNDPTAFEHLAAAGFQENSSRLSLSNLAYLEEAFYFVPVHIALQLQRSNEYVAALDWFSLVYDYTKPAKERALVGLAPQTSADPYKRADDWLLDPLNPHAIARTRDKTYLRYTLLAIIKCLLDYADAEFTQDTSESVPRARELYMTALQLLNSDDLKQHWGICDDIIGKFNLTVGAIWSELSSGTEKLPQIDLSKMTVEVLNDLQRHLMGLFANQTLEKLEKFDLAKKAVELAKHKAPPLPPRFGEKLSLDDAAHPKLLSGVLADRDIASVVENVPVSKMFDFGFEKTVRTISLPMEGSDGPLGSVELKFSIDTLNIGGSWKPVFHGFCIPPNPVLRSLNLRANLNLYKIRTCRNIAGMKRQLEIFAAPTDTHTGMPVIGAGGQLVLPGLVRFQPTPYRYQVLVERAKQLVQLAMQIEQAFLSALEKTDAAAYDILQARQALRLSMAGVQLQKLRVTEAVGGVKLAGLQRDRASIQVNTYDEWINAGLIQAEWDMINGYWAQFATHSVSIGLGAVLDASRTNPGFTNALAIKAVADVASTYFQTMIQVRGIVANFERRKQEWELQKALAEQDERIGDQQISMAEDHVRVAEQESTIAEMQSDNAKEVVDFLTNKFTNKELYDWMSGVLERVYSFFLQQATATAQLAQNQLGFERQETPPAYIQADYWEAPSEDTGNGKAPDRRGLTGSARLLQDIYQLDQYAFDTNKRKQQLTKTISLAQLDPFAFQRFRDTGVLPFATPMELFDRDFPGHYLRLIKRIRTSVVALIPPSQGIRATLSTTGLSRVVTGGDMFQKINLRRDPETVALSAPINATGLFELDAQASSEMLLPFEGTGVDAAWEFSMLKGSNSFDYSTIADVLFTMEYTALNSFDYQQEVIQSPALNRPISADRAYSFRSEFADAWYDLHNPDQTNTPMIVTFETFANDFPPNVRGLRVQQILMYFASSGDNPVLIEDVKLNFTENGQAGTAGGSATTGDDGVISTRRGNAGPWNGIIGKYPAGEWKLQLPDNPTVRSLFDDAKKDHKDHIADILFVITYSGRTPEWPA